MVLFLTTDDRWVPNFVRWGFSCGNLLLCAIISWSFCLTGTVAQALGISLGLGGTLGTFLGLLEGGGAKETCSLTGAFKNKN